MEPSSDPRVPLHLGRMSGKELEVEAVAGLCVARLQELLLRRKTHHLLFTEEKCALVLGISPV